MAKEENVEITHEGSRATLNLQVFVCNICGYDHETENCAVVNGLKLVYDSKILSRARQTLPKNLDVKTLVDGTVTVVTNVKIEQGTCFGPLQAPSSVDLPASVTLPLKVFGQSLDDGYYLDTTDEHSCNWMCLVPTATTTKDQNLICFEMKQSIYFATTREVLPGEELRLWYALYYGLKLQALPLAEASEQEESLLDPKNHLERKFQPNIEEGEELVLALAQHLPAHVLGASGERDVWPCKLCAVRETNVAQYARHLMTHYRQPLHNSNHLRCKECGKYFFSRKLFEKHISKVHTCSEGQGVAMFAKTTVNKLQPELVEEILHSRSGEHNVSTSQETAILRISELESVKKKKLPKPSSENNLGELKNNFETAISDENTLLDSRGVDERTRTSWESRAELTDNPSSTVELHLPLSCMELSDSQQLEQLSNESKLDVFSDSNLKERGRKLIAPSSKAEILSATYNLQEAQNFDKTVGDEACLKLVTEVSCSGNGSSGATLDENVASLQGIDGSSSIPQDDLNANLSSPECSDQNSIEKTNAPYKCDICQKSFGKCSYLYRHLRKHTGEFTCVTCLAVFARKENLKSHSCSQPKQWFPCPACGKKFSARKYLQRHTPMHTGEFTCSACKRLFVSRLSLKFHRCKNLKSSAKKGVICALCKCEFDSDYKLRSHLKFHTVENSAPTQSKTTLGKSYSCQSQIKLERGKLKQNFTKSEICDGKEFICEVCGATFKSLSSMKTHRFCHGERKFECEVCKKRFHRKDVLQEHLRVHEEANFPCLVCGKKYKTKKSLYVHSLIHEGLKRFTCSACGKAFFQKGNLLKHMQTHTSERLYSCQYCNKSFSSKEYFSIHELTHTQGKIHQCDKCDRSFVKKHLLDTHRQVFHSNKGFLCKFCNTVIRHRHSIRRHLEKCHTDNRHEWSIPSFIDQLLVELPSTVLQPVSDAKLTPKEQQERQHQLESLRKKYFPAKFQDTRDETQTLSDGDYLPVAAEGLTLTSSFPQEHPGDPLVMFSSPQLALVENFLPDYDQSHAPGSECQSLMLSGNLQASEGEILLTLVNQEDTNTSSPVNETSVFSSTVLESDIIGLDSGTTFMMEDGGETSSVLLYVVESSNGDDCESEDLVWCSDSVGEQL